MNIHLGNWVPLSIDLQKLYSNKSKSSLGKEGYNIMLMHWKKKWKWNRKWKCTVQSRRAPSHLTFIQWSFHKSLEAFVPALCSFLSSFHEGILCWNSWQLSSCANSSSSGRCLDFSQMSAFPGSFIRSLQYENWLPPCLFGSRIGFNLCSGRLVLAADVYLNSQLSLLRDTDASLTNGKHWTEDQIHTMFWSKLITREHRAWLKFSLWVNILDILISRVNLSSIKLLI